MKHPASALRRCAYRTSEMLQHLFENGLDPQVADTALRHERSRLTVALDDEGQGAERLRERPARHTARTDPDG